MSLTAHAAFWARTKRWTLGLLLVWLLVNLGLPWFARDLNAFRLAGFPAGYWLAAQGALLIYLLVIVAYVWAMDRLEARCLDEREQEAAPSSREPGEA
jgi:putative solute:sodium symporter small subunit